MAESNAILFYLARDSTLLPDTPLTQVQILQWLFFEQYSHEPYIATSRFWIALLGKEEKYRDDLEKKRAPGYAALRLIDSHLANMLISSPGATPSPRSAFTPTPMSHPKATLISPASPIF